MATTNDLCLIIQEFLTTQNTSKTVAQQEKRRLRGQEITYLERESDFYVENAASVELLDQFP